MTDRDIETWKRVDIVDTARFDDAYFDDLAASIDEAAAAADVVSIAGARARRVHRAAVALIAAAVVAAVLWGRPSPDAPVAQAPDAPTADALADEIAAELVPGGLDELTDDLSARAALASELETGAGLARDDLDTDPDTFAASGSWMAELDDLSTDELAALAARL